MIVVRKIFALLLLALVVAGAQAQTQSLPQLLFR